MGISQEKIVKELSQLFNKVILRPKPLPLIERPLPDAINTRPAEMRYESVLAEYNDSIADRRKSHDECSKVVKRVFYTLLATCIFSLITISGIHDIQLITMDAVVQLPIINYDLRFGVFLIIAPIILTGLFVYLHIFFGQLRLLTINESSSFPALFNIDSISAKIVTWVLFYWLVPIVLAVFTWTSSPRAFESYFLFILTMSVTVLSVLLQLRRCPIHWLIYVAIIYLPLLFLGNSQLEALVANRIINLYKADLSGKDMRNMRLHGAFMAESILDGANLEGAVLFGANLEGAKLVNTRLTLANLKEANLENANLEGAILDFASLSSGNLENANFINARFKSANLDNANLRNADLKGAYLKFTDLNGTNLEGANLKEVVALTCLQLKSAINWQKSLRDSKLVCNSEIPEQ